MGGLFDVVKLTSKGSRLTVEQISESSPYVRMTKAFMENRPITTAQGVKDVDRPAAISAQGLGLRPLGMNPATSLIKAVDEKNYLEVVRSTTAHFLDYAGKVVNLPGRFLTAEDEFFKALNYRAFVRTQASKEVKLAHQGLRPKGESIEGTL